ncbi:DUF2206 domain-containing protein [Chloroflexota bacterium]
MNNPVTIDTNDRSRRYFLLLILSIIVISVAISINLPVVKPVGALILLFIIPGILLIYVFKIGHLGFAEKTVLTIGLSIAFILLFGLFINFTLPLFGIKPLSQRAILISFALAIMGLSIIAYWKSRASFNLRISRFTLTSGEKLILIISVLCLLIAVIGIFLMNRFDINAVVLMVPPLVVIIFIIAYIKEPSTHRILPALIFITSLSLLILPALLSNHLIGEDVHQEYFIFHSVYEDQEWQVYPSDFAKGTFNSCISTTILPAISAKLTGIELETGYRLLFRIMFAFMPVAMFLTWRKMFKGNHALLAVFFIISQIAFLAVENSGRTNVALFFFSLFLLVLFYQNISQRQKVLLLFIFAASIVLSHYATAYIFIFIIGGAWLVHLLLSRYLFKTSSSIFYNRLLGLPFLLLLAFILYLWLGLITGAPFEKAIEVFRSAITGIGDSFSSGSGGTATKAITSTVESFSSESRGTLTSSAFGGVMDRGVPYIMEFFLSWITIGVTTMGVIGLLIYRFLLKRFRIFQNISNDMLIMAFCAISILALAVVLPNVLVFYALDRTYLQAVMILAPFFIAGALLLSKLRRYIFPLVIAICMVNFLMVSGFGYELMGSSKSMIYGSNNFEYDAYYVSDQESVSAAWLGKYRDDTRKIYGDYRSKARLISQGQIPYININDWMLSNMDKYKGIDGYIYLRYYNLNSGKLLDEDSYESKLAGVDIDEKWLEKKATIYSNSKSEVFM